MGKLLAAIVGAVLVGAIAPSPVIAAGDNLSLHEKDAILIMVMSQTCADCPAAPNQRTLRWRFASDFGSVSGTRSAYTVLSYRSEGGKPLSWLFGWDSYRGGNPNFGGGWVIKARSVDGRTRFQCGTSVLLNPNYRIDAQIRLVKRIAVCI